MSPRVAGAVLAAGESRRLGHPKQLARHRGETLASLAAQCVVRSRATHTGAVVGARADAVSATLRHLPVEIVPNPDWERGMATSIRVAVAWAEQQHSDALLLVLCDQPRLTTAHLDRLISAFERTGVPAASYYAEKCAVPALFPRALFPALATLEGDSGARRLLNDGRVVTQVPWPDGEFDVDTSDSERELTP